MALALIVEDAEERKPAKVERPPTLSVEVAVIAPPKNEVPLVYWLPWTERSAVGEVVPMPTLPPLVMVNKFVATATLAVFALCAVRPLWRLITKLSDEPIVPK